MILKCTS